MKAAPSRMKTLPTLRATFVVVLDDEDDVESGLHAVEGRRSSQAIAAFKAGFKTAGATPKGTVANPERPGSKNVPQSRDLGLVSEDGQSN